MPLTLAMSPCVVCSQSPALKGWPKVTGSLGWVWGLVEATSMHVMAPSAQLNAFVAIGGGSVGVSVGMGAGGNSGLALGAEGSVGSSCEKEAALPPPQLAKEARKNRLGSHFR